MILIFSDENIKLVARETATSRKQLLVSSNSPTIIA